VPRPAPIDDFFLSAGILKTRFNCLRFWMSSNSTTSSTRIPIVSSWVRVATWTTMITVWSVAVTLVARLLRQWYFDGLLKRGSRYSSQPAVRVRAQRVEEHRRG